MKKHYRHENDCLNCGTILEGKFCHHCGQENLEIRENFGHLMNHAISDYFHFDHQFFHTLKPLLFKPGKLTNEYMAGRRVQYLHPIKMYIFISLIYFLLLFKSDKEAVKVTTNDKKTVNREHQIDEAQRQIDKNPAFSASQKKLIDDKLKAAKLKKGIDISVVDNDDDKHLRHSVLTTTDDSTYQQYEASQAKLSADDKDGFLEHLFNKKMFSYREKYGDRAKEAFIEEFEHNIPKMMFLILPLFALILRIAFWKNHKFYVEHLIHSFHLHCFLFLFLAVVMICHVIIPYKAVTTWIDLFATVSIAIYFYKSLRAVYHRSRFRTITKMFGMSFMYSFVFGMCMLLLLAVTALTAA